MKDTFESLFYGKFLYFKFLFALVYFSLTEFYMHVYFDFHSMLVLSWRTIDLELMCLIFYISSISYSRYSPREFFETD